MPRPAGVARVVLEGTLPGNEIFRTGFWALPTNPPSTLAQWIVQVGLLVAPINTFVTWAVNLLDADGSWDSFSAYWYADPGPAPATLVSQQPITAGTGVSTNDAQPNQVAMVASLRTDYSGRSSRGRMYLPASRLSIDSATHQINGGFVNDAATHVAQLFTDVNDAGFTVSVVSATQSDLHAVTTVRVDSRPDVQRRRANKQLAIDVGVAAV